MDTSVLNLAPASAHAAGHVHGRGPAAGGVPDSRADPGGFARVLEAAVAPDAAAATQTPGAVDVLVADPGTVRSADGKDTGVAEAPGGAASPAAARLLRRSLRSEPGAVPAVGAGPVSPTSAASVPAQGPDTLPAAGLGRAGTRVSQEGQAGAEAAAVVPWPGPAARAAPDSADPVAVEFEPAPASAVAPADDTNSLIRARSRSDADADATDPVATAAVATSGTALMQWMLQMAPPVATPVPAPVGTAAEPGTPGLGRQEGGALRQTAVPAGLAGRFELAELANQDKTARGDGAGRAGPLEAARANSASERGARPARDPGLPGVDRKDVDRKGGALLATPAAAPASISGGGHVPAPQEDRGSSAGPLESTRGTARAPAEGGGAAAGPDPQALLSAVPAVATPSATAGGSPVVAPAQTWIQTPVTQPGFSDEVVVELVRRAGQAEQGRQEVTLHLNPAEMGPVSVSIELHGSTARVEFSASEALTRHHLEAALPGLNEALRDEGLSLTHSRVHEASRESLAASAAGGPGSDPTGSGGAGSDARARSDAFADARSGGYGERAPRRPADLFSVDGRAVGASREPLSIGPSPGRVGRLDLFA